MEGSVAEAPPELGPLLPAAVQAQASHHPVPPRPPAGLKECQGSLSTGTGGQEDCIMLLFMSGVDTI